jgi:tyrosyl-DNA phosphodiesterase 2
MAPESDDVIAAALTEIVWRDSTNKRRQVRFDRVLLKGPAWAPASIDLLGTEAISSTHPRVFQSDHFGVMCTVVQRPAHSVGG